LSYPGKQRRTRGPDPATLSAGRFRPRPGSLAGAARRWGGAAWPASWPRSGGCAPGSRRRPCPPPRACAPCRPRGRSAAP